MSRYRNAVASNRAHIGSLRLVIVVLVVICAGLWYGWQTAPQDLTIHIPPDLRGGATQKWWYVPPATVYTFAFYIWQQLNRWPANGKVDYRRNIRRLTPYLTPGCQRRLMQNYHERVERGELRDRVRSLQAIPGRGFTPEDVNVLNRDTWIVRIDAQITEYLYGMAVRDLYIRYFLRVVRRNVDPETNPFGLMLDCFAKPAVEIDRPDQGKAGTS